jgi:small subunit ribosomal protein S4
MEKKSRPGAARTGGAPTKEKTGKEAPVKNARKLSEFGKQQAEKQKIKEMYGLREKQFRRFFGIAVRSQGAPGANLLSLLERRLDNTLFKLKLATTRAQARQVIVHGHVLVNGKKVYSPSFLVSINDVVSFAQNVFDKKLFVEQVVDKRLNVGVKVPEWLELMKNDRKGRVLRLPVRDDIQVPVEEHLIVELYSK